MCTSLFVFGGRWKGTAGMLHKHAARGRQGGEAYGVRWGACGDLYAAWGTKSTTREDVEPRKLQPPPRSSGRLRPFYSTTSFILWLLVTGSRC